MNVKKEKVEKSRKTVENNNNRIINRKHNKSNLKI